MRYLVLILALALVPSCATQSSYYDLDFWAKPNFKRAEDPAKPADAAPDLTTPAEESASS
ncbi:MAG TPA: hypothetical protein PLJ47_01535 [Candidatus Hydrogenedentes bacterium]|nr:hypothetical protein [Candidatus Hydrogenedentota bacterium]HRK33247.1 hypothetical protein [Candidatus Hydrogenedentota bacterium]